MDAQPGDVIHHISGGHDPWATTNCLKENLLRLPDQSEHMAIHHALKKLRNNNL
jgi:hypothetical protein